MLVPLLDSQSTAVARPKSQKGTSLASTSMSVELERHMQDSNSQDTDPMLTAFGDYMLKHLRATDICMVGNIMHFNVNQCSYIIEGCTTLENKRATRKRIADGLAVLPHFTVKCAHTKGG